MDYARKSGRFWVAEDEARILGCVACRPAPQRPRYAPARPGRGEATTRRAAYITLWTDTRFEAAHAFYEAHGFRKEI